MGIKMKKVKYKGEELRISDYKKGYTPLKCFYCNADISYVSSHERDMGERKVIVSPYFRLKNGQVHGTGCKYTVDGEILDIVARCADNNIITKENDKFKVRLLLVAEDTEENHTKKNTFDDLDVCGKRKLNYIEKGKTTAYLSSMKRIMKLRTEVESNADLREKLILEFPKSNGETTKVLWDKFYYEAAKENDYSKLLKNMYKKVYYPICIDGIFKEVKKIENNHGSYQIMNFEPVKLGESETKNDERVSISYFIHDNEVIEELKGQEGKRVVVYTQCYYKDSKKWVSSNSMENKKEIFYHHIRGNIYNKRQMLIINDLY